jgi:hypothetical protein
MKKVLSIILILAFVFMAVACASKPVPQQSTGLPDWVQAARRNAPEDVIVGIGSAKLATTNQSMTTSETRARAQIVRAMQSMVTDMVRDFTESSEVDPDAKVAFQEQFTRSLASANVAGARIIEQNADETGTWWTVVYYSRSQAAEAINQAQNAARLAVPAARAYDAEARMDEALRQATQQTWMGDN